MTLSKQARKSRHSRVLEERSGTWGSSSQDFLHLANLLFEKSVAHAKQTDGNCSVYVLAGIPILFSALRCLLIELNAGMYSGLRNKNGLAELTVASNDIEIILRRYSIPADLKERLIFLLEIRNEIIHPAHRPEEKNGTPAYLLPLRHAGLLQSTGSDADYIWISQLQSHKLLTWAFATVRETVEILLSTHTIASFMANGLRKSYSRYEDINRDL